jgi:hypothetical protein
MVDNRIASVRRAYKPRITIPEVTTTRRPGLYDCRLVALRPEEPQVSDITYVVTWGEGHQFTPTATPNHSRTPGLR